jgi:hypothetical protein
MMRDIPYEWWRFFCEDDFDTTPNSYYNEALKMKKPTVKSFNVIGHVEAVKLAKDGRLPYRFEQGYLSSCHP